MSSKLTELRGKRDELRKKAETVFKEMGPDNDLSKVTALDGADDKAKAEQIQALNDEVNQIQVEIESLEGVDKARESFAAMAEPNPHPGHPTGNGRRDGDAKSIGELFTAHAAFAKVGEGHMGPEANFDNIDIKATLFQTSGGWSAPSLRSDRVVPYAVRPLVITDVLPVINVNLPTYLYMEETTFTNSAVEVAEGASKPELALALTERTETVRKVAGYLPVTDEQLEDVPAARQYIDNRLGYMIKQRLETQVISGNGSGVNIAGINYATRSSIQQQARSSDSSQDAIFKAITKIRVNAYSEPNAVVIHPTNWQTIRLATASGSGVYLFGPPSDAGVERLWGLQPIITTGITLNLGLVGDFNQAALLFRQGLTMKVGYVNDDLIKNRQTIVAELRAAVAVFRPAAFCEVTSLN